MRFLLIGTNPPRDVNMFDMFLACHVRLVGAERRPPVLHWPFFSFVLERGSLSSKLALSFTGLDMRFILF